VIFLANNANRNFSRVFGQDRLFCGLFLVLKYRFSSKILFSKGEVLNMPKRIGKGRIFRKETFVPLEIGSFENEEIKVQRDRDLVSKVIKEVVDFNGLG
jgi:hypothetical protein